jgi:HK97 family phage major capsid protein
MDNNLTPEQVVEKLDNLFAEKMQSLPKTEDVESLRTELTALKGLEQKSNEIEKSIAKFEGRLEAMAEKSVPTIEQSVKTIAGKIVQTLATKHDEIMDNIEKGQKFSLDLKVDTTIAGDYTGTRALTELDTEINVISRPIRRIREIANVAPTSSKAVTYIQQTTQSTTGFLNEAVAKANGQLQYTEVTVNVTKVAGLIKISKEMLGDLSFMQGEVNRDLMESVDQNIDNGLLNGNGSAPNLNGVINQATTWTAGTFAGTITNATIIDVLRVAKANIEASNFTPTHIILHPEDVAKIELAKDTNGGYTYPVFYNLGSVPNMILSGMVVVQSKNMTAGNFLVGDFSKFNVKVREDLNMTIGYDMDDFSRNMVSMIVEARLCSYVKANDTGAFQKGVIATAIAAL